MNQKQKRERAERKAQEKVDRGSSEEKDRRQNRQAGRDKGNGKRRWEEQEDKAKETES